MLLILYRKEIIECITDKYSRNKREDCDFSDEEFPAISQFCRCIGPILNNKHSNPSVTQFLDDLHCMRRGEGNHVRTIERSEKMEKKFRSYEEQRENKFLVTLRDDVFNRIIDV